MIHVPSRSMSACKAARTGHLHEQRKFDVTTEHFSRDVSFGKLVCAVLHRLGTESIFAMGRWPDKLAKLEFECSPVSFIVKSPVRAA